MTLWKTFPGLQVYLPSYEYLFATKVMAGRRKDDDDVKALAIKLHISTIKETLEIVQRYVSNADITDDSLRLLGRCFQK